MLFHVRTSLSPPPRPGSETSLCSMVVLPVASEIGLVAVWTFAARFFGCRSRSTISRIGSDDHRECPRIQRVKGPPCGIGPLSEGCPCHIAEAGIGVLGSCPGARNALRERNREDHQNHSLNHFDSISRTKFARLASKERPRNDLKANNGQHPTGLCEARSQNTHSRAARLTPTSGT